MSIDWVFPIVIESADVQPVVLAGVEGTAYKLTAYDDVSADSLNSAISFSYDETSNTELNVHFTTNGANVFVDMFGNVCTGSNNLIMQWPYDYSYFQNTPAADEQVELTGNLLNHYKQYLTELIYGTPHYSRLFLNNDGDVNNVFTGLKDVFKGLLLNTDETMTSDTVNAFQGFIMKAVENGRFLKSDEDSGENKLFQAQDTISFRVKVETTLGMINAEGTTHSLPAASLPKLATRQIYNSENGKLDPCVWTLTFTLN